MAIKRVVTFIGILLIPVACARNRDTAAATEPRLTNQALLEQLAREDQAVQRGAEVARTQEQREALVLAELARGNVRTPADRANAALVLQHTGFTFCDKKLVSINPDNYLLAHYLAKSAFESGYQDAKYLVPQTIDRYLSMTQGYQKYGTNRLNNPETGAEELVYIDRNTTDSERATYGVPPLAVLLKQFPERQKKAADQ